MFGAKRSQRDQILLFTQGEERNPGIKGNPIAPVFWQNQTLAME